jgi:hypothetical protein
VIVQYSMCKVYMIAWKEGAITLVRTIKVLAFIIHNAIMTERKSCGNVWVHPNYDIRRVLALTVSS